MDEGKLLKFGANIPIITGARSWKGMGMQINPVDPQDLWPETGQTVAQAFPRGLFMVVVFAVRSDDMPCKVILPLSGQVIRDPFHFDGALRHGWGLLNTYRDCECTVTQTCANHVRAQAYTPEKGGSDAGNEVPPGSENGDHGPAKIH